ncbi:enoyl-CoA hydratase/isomerase family protein [Halalkalicoccus jeotgali]|uniref:Enoyl-CoA hydratase/isomerase n=1 Tax=Halalkalicoccus jeotgali (strain DSM 18796 / CECT 7217 / JCM 14584 / KCTC 4019 / B3) TaxID=795797 RepID=D8JB41_HALJB|nr:enoyl-CoA hydratase/isomerase family protein [Halalkalicoccus jeotgali]ADJ16494.1 Enoyl-CoA hydratase/isomerase [Halalkalicoccus jeotgali B3]ELY41410.1 Enoyl-CoA hydratase/isomerase [Halalkalicoccus jeotgali B3]
MQFDTLDLAIEGDGIATLRLTNGPVNAINQRMRHELAEALDILREDRVRVAVVTGSEEVFSVGADVALFEEAREWTSAEFRTNSRVLGRVFDGLEEIEKPVLAAINGTCVGGGLELALACDVRIAAPDAILGFPEHNIGLLPGLGGCSRFVHLVGPGRAKDMIFSQELVDGERAGDIGLVERVEEDPEATAYTYADSLLDRPPQALGLAKRVVNAARDTDTRSAGLLESLAQSTLLETDDHREGIEAFRGKRDPEFTGE